MKNPFAILLATFLFPLANPAGADTVEIHYVTIGAETDVAITPETIVDLATHHARLRPDDPILRYVADLLASAEAGSPLDTLQIRARLTYPNGDVIFIDNAGSIRVNESNLRLDRSAHGNLGIALSLFTTQRPSTVIPFCTEDDDAVQHAQRNWAVQAIHDYIGKAHGWDKADYRIVYIGKTLASGCLLRVNVNHRDDGKPERDEVLTTGGGKSFQITLDPDTREVLRTFHFQ